MSLSDCEIAYDAAASLHERAWQPIVSGVQFGRGGAIATGTLAAMVKKAVGMPKESWGNLSITVDPHAAEGKTWLEFVQIEEIARRPDFPR
jgi:hypothetical protein